jgi:hypothetical protein
MLNNYPGSSPKEIMDVEKFVADSMNDLKATLEKTITEVTEQLLKNIRRTVPEFSGLAGASDFGISNNALPNLEDVKNEEPGIAKQQNKTSYPPNTFDTPNATNAKHEEAVKVINLRGNKRKSLFDIAFKDENSDFESGPGQMNLKNILLEQNKFPHSNHHFPNKHEEKRKNPKKEKSEITKKKKEQKR